MLRGAIYHIRLWLCYVRGNWLALLAYRADFVVSNVANLIFNILLVLSVRIIFGHVDSIGMWTFEQVLFFYSLAMLGRSIWHIFCVNMMTLTVLIRNGWLDRLLVRPANPLFQLVADYLDNDDWGELFFGVFLLAYSSSRLGVVGGIFDVLLLALMVLSAAAVYFALHLAANSSAFWLINNSAVTQMVWDLDGFSRYPLDIYSKSLSFVMTWIIPLGFVSFYPAQALIGTGSLRYLGLATPLVAGVACVVAYRIWNIGLIRYHSTGS